MTSKKFSLYFSCGFLALAGVVVPLNAYFDIYGLFRPTSGRKMTIYGEERLAKYLYGFRYIPENFDGILLGSSVSDTLDTTKIPGYRIYNASISGGNVAEAKPIVENVFRQREMKVTIICVHRYFTKDHLPKTDLMNPRQYWSALGSPQLMTAYLSRLAMERGLTTPEYNSAGVRRFESKDNPVAARKKIESALADIAAGTAAIGDYSIDPVALRDLDGVMNLARRRSQHVIVFYPPTPEPVLVACLPALTQYRNTIRPLIRPSDIVVDFNGPGYEAIRADYGNFIDGVHLSKAGAAAVMNELSKIVAAPESQSAEALSSPR